MKKNILVLFCVGIIAIIIFIKSFCSNKKPESYLQDSLYLRQGTFKDTRDGKVYKTIKIGRQIIMSENLAYKPDKGNYCAYHKDRNNVNKYGYCYDWETAKKVAPAGWHLPTHQEWQELLNFLSGYDLDVYNSLLENGSSGFNALIGHDGWNINDPRFWSASTMEGYDIMFRKNACAWYFFCENKILVKNVYLKPDDKQCLCSIRLFRD